MEHTRNSEILAVLLRFLRRYWRNPAQAPAVLAITRVALLALSFLPRLSDRLQASSAAAGGSGW